MIGMTTSTRVRTAVLAAALTVLTPFAAVSASTPPSPGNATAVAANVAASSKINSLPSSLLASVSGATNDSAWVNYPALGTGCSSATSCVFGDTSSSTTIVLFGDSHAAMWLPALDQIASSHHERLVVLWHGMCPVATLDVNAPAFGYPNACNNARAQSISLIHSLAPKLVIIGEKTAGVPGMHGTYTAKDWLPSLKASINAIKSPSTKVAVLEDTASFPQLVPTCLSIHPTSVQKCGVYWSTTKPGLQATQQQAATATGSLYVQTDKWFCTKTCSPVIGSFIAYMDGTHISASYSVYLSGVLDSALKKDL